MLPLYYKEATMRSLRNLFLLLFLLPLCIVFMAFKKNSSGKWTKDQLISPKVLAQKMKAGEAGGMLILNTGPVENIAGAVNIGAVEEEANVQKLEQFLAVQPRDKEIIIYCGCCPLAGCPNIEPACNKLQQMKFTNFKILNLPQDLQEDWIDKGYPMAAAKD